MPAIKQFLLPGSSPAISLRELGVDGPLVILLHGIGGNSTNWTQQIHALSKNYKAVAWDMRGYGKSEDYNGPLVIEDVCADILAIIEHYQADKAHLVGLSMGGMLAQEFFELHPHRVNSMVLANTNAGVGLDFYESEKKEFVRLRKQPLVEGKTPAELVDSMLGVLLGDNPPRSAIDNITESISSLHKESYIKAIEAIVQFNSIDVLPKINVPVLLIGSTNDRVIPLDSMHLLQAKINTATLHVFKGVGHLSNLEKPEEFNKLMLNFLAGV